MAKQTTYTPVIQNRKANFEYEILFSLEAGMVLSGTEIKSIRAGKVNLGDAYCNFQDGALFIRNMHISEYPNASFQQHEPRRSRKLLLNKSEIKKIEGKLKDTGITIVPLDVHFSDRGFAKVQIAVVRGKKLHDKRDSIRDREVDRSMRRGEA